MARGQDAEQQQQAQENSIAGLLKVGLDPSIYFDEIVTSGEMAWQYIESREITKDGFRVRAARPSEGAAHG